MRVKTIAFWLLLALLPLGALAQSEDHSGHAGHELEAPPVLESSDSGGGHAGHGLEEPAEADLDAGHGHADMAQESSPVVSAVTFILAGAVIFGFILFFRGIAGKDLLEFSVMRKLMKSRFYPLALQIPTFIFFLFIFYFFFFGSLSYSKNPGSILAWTLWWPLVPLTFILLGRIWCVICPLPLIGDFVQKFVNPTRRPGKFLVKYGIWITDGIFIAITLFDRLYGMVETPWLSGAVFILILFGTVIISVTYERRTFCKHICFLGGVSGNYSMLSGLSIETKNPQVCATCKTKACFFGSGKAPGCPYFSTMPAKAGMRNCNLCASCIKNCPNDNIALKARSIASELWSHAKVSFSESFFAKLMVGVVIIQNLGMLAVWSGLQDAVMGWGFGEKMAITILYFAAIALPLILMSVTSFVSSRLQSVKGGAASNFAAFGYAFIPIDVAGHLAHNLFHLLAEGKSILGAFVGLFTGKVSFSGPIVSSPVVTGLQFALIAVGSLGTLYVAYKIARAKEDSVGKALMVVFPHTLLLLVIIGINIFLFITPMAHRGG